MKRQYVIIFIIAVWALVMPEKSKSYVMPADQIIDLMATNFSSLETLFITQSSQVLNPSNQEIITVREEKLLFKAPDLFHVEIMGGSVGQEKTGIDLRHDPPGINMIFRRLFIAGSGETISAFLSNMDIDLESVALARFNGVIAYRLGDTDPGSPALLIEKERFLPLLFSYRMSGQSAQYLVSVQFDDYRKLDGGWYPYRITYSAGEQLLELYLADNLQINIPIECSLSKIPLHGPDILKGPLNEQGNSDEERLRDIIRTLKEKHHSIQ